MEIGVFKTDMDISGSGSGFNHCMALNSLLCADVPLSTYTLISGSDH